MERQIDCRRVSNKTCSGCLVGDIVVERIIIADDSVKTRDLLLEIAKKHCPEGLAPEGIILPSDIHSERKENKQRNGKSGTDSKAPGQAEVAA